MDQRRIVIVARDEATQQQLGRSLVRLGYSIAGTGERVADVMEAVAVADVVLVDAGGGDAADAALRTAIRAQVSVPVVFLAGHEPAWAAAPDATVVHGVLSRPYSSRELQCVIEIAASRNDTSRAVDATEQRFFDLSIDLLCHLDFSGYFRRLNPAWERTLGFSREELMARPFIEFVHPDDRERTLTQNRRVRQGERALAFENRYRCRNGSYRWLRWNAAPDPSYRTIYSVARDVTAEKEASAEREALLGRLQEAQAEVEALQEILPVCSCCRKVRDDEHFWHSVKTYLAIHTEMRLSHAICPSCMAADIAPQRNGYQGEPPPHG
jgi:PAS domain S-box-containing protein